MLSAVKISFWPELHFQFIFVDEPRRATCLAALEVRATAVVMKYAALDRRS
jgi:hypothetical protein